MKPTLLFLATFLVGAVLAFATRTALHEPYAEPAPLVATAAPAVDPHAGHTGTAPTAPVATVNTVCPICAMDVDPDLKPATYQGKLVGFGCAACPPRFTKDPDRYGPSALRNEVVKK